MSAISTILTRLANTVALVRSAIFAIDVRDDIADAIEKCGEAIEQCYSDVSNPTLQTEALEAALQTKIDEGEMAALTIGDGTITAAKLASGVIDNTLITAGAAADAKKTGDEIAAVKADLDAQTEGVFPASNVEGLWEQGSYNLSTGNKSSTLSYASRIRTTGYLSKVIKHIEADDYAQFVLLIYNNGSYLGMWNGTAIVSSSVWISSADINDISGNYDYNIAVRNKADTSAEITPTYAQHLTFSTNTGKAVSGLTEDVSGCFDGEAMVGSTPIIDDFNNAIINRYYSINTTGIENQPEESKGHLLYFGLEGGKTNVKSGRELQFFITHNNDFFFRGNRFSSGAPWNTWAKLAKNTDIPYIPRPSLALFQSIGIIGDSFASGEIYDANAGTHADHYALSWGQILARMCGCTAVNYSKGGLTTKSWLTDASYGLTKLNAENANNLYIVALGINDANHSDTIPVGTIADIESNSAANFYSYYGQIIRAIKTHAPNAVIMLSTLARFGNTYNPYSDAVKAIGTYYDLPVLDLSESVFFQSDFFANNQISNHPTAVNYSAMAKEYKWLIEKALEDNAADFAGYIG